jgi:transcriptional regulator with XRE-family HTH domain
VRRGSEIDRTLASVIKELREEQEVSQEQLAVKAGLTASALSRIEREFNAPSWTTVVRIVSALGYGMAEFGALVDASRQRSRVREAAAGAESAPHALRPQGQPQRNHAAEIAGHIALGQPTQR